MPEIVVTRPVPGGRVEAGPKLGGQRQVRRPIRDCDRRHRGLHRPRIADGALPDEPLCMSVPGCMPDRPCLRRSRPLLTADPSNGQVRWDIERKYRATKVRSITSSHQGETSQRSHRDLISF